MTNFFSFLKQHPLPSRQTLSIFLKRPLTWYGLVLYGLFASIVIIFYILIITINQRFLVSIPASGGSIVEGVIGAPHLINPVLAKTDTDKDIVALVYSGLLTQNSDGTYAPDLALELPTTNDNRTFHFTLRQGLKWSDNKELTSADILYTISKLSDQTLRSDTYWYNVTVTTPDPYTVDITLPETSPDLPTFFEHATVGILPQHIWNDSNDFITSPHNLRPIGSGPYAISHISTQNNISQTLTLKRNKHYTLKHPYIKDYKFVFFANQNELAEAVKTANIDMTIAANPLTASTASSSDYQIKKIKTPTSVGLFHIIQDTYFSNKKFTDIINRSVDKNIILATVENGYGILPETDQVELTTEQSIDELTAIGFTSKDGLLQKDNTPVSFSIAVENDATLLLAARALASELARLGITAIIRPYDKGIFQDGVDNNQYTLIIAHTQNNEPLQEYVSVLPLYFKAYPLIYKPFIYIPLPAYLDRTTDRYSNINDWYAKINNVWPLFIRNNSTIINKT